jgi:hypothetical protein
LGGQLRPQLGPDSFVQFHGRHGERLGAHLDVNAGIGLEVVVPGGVRGGSSFGGDDEEAAVLLGEAARRVTCSIPDLAPMWWTRISGVPSHGPATRPWLARNSSMIWVL